MNFHFIDTLRALIMKCAYYGYDYIQSFAEFQLKTFRLSELRKATLVSSYPVHTYMFTNVNALFCG